MTEHVSIDHSSTDRSRTGHDDGFSRATGVIADFDSPFYAEERQRDVWNEASALGFQTMLWGGHALACAMVWIGGRPQVPWAAALLAVVSVASWLTLIHANRLGVTGRENTRLQRPRLALFGALYAATLAGMLIRSDIDLEPATIAGAVVGVLLAAVGVSWATRRRQQREEQLEQ